MKAKPDAQSLSSTIPQETEPVNGLHELIRTRAYELYEQRGRQDGCDVNDWLQSESEVTAKLGTTAIAA